MYTSFFFTAQHFNSWVSTDHICWLWSWQQHCGQSAEPPRLLTRAVPWPQFWYPPLEKFLISLLETWQTACPLTSPLSKGHLWLTPQPALAFSLPKAWAGTEWAKKPVLCKGNPHRAAQRDTFSARLHRQFPPKRLRPNAVWFPAWLYHAHEEFCTDGCCEGERFSRAHGSKHQCSKAWCCSFPCSLQAWPVTPVRW